MTKSVKKVLLICTLFMSIVLLTLGAIGINYNTVNADTTENTGITADTVIALSDGVSVNVKSEEKSGLRFTAQLDKNIFKAILETYSEDNVKTGMLTVPTDFVLDAAKEENGTREFTIAGLDGYAPLSGYTYYAYNTKNYNSVGDVYEFYMTIPGISESNYNREFSARAYIEITATELVVKDDLGLTAEVNAKFTNVGDKWYAYSDYDVEKNSASVYEVAFAAYISGNAWEDHDTVSPAIAKKFIDGVVDIKIDGTTATLNNVEGKYESPFALYESATGNYILNCKGKTPETMLVDGERVAVSSFTKGGVTVHELVASHSGNIAQSGQAITYNEQGNGVSLPSLQTGGSTGPYYLWAKQDSVSYVAFEGEYGVGTYIDATFKGNNMPQIMMFADSINGNFTNYTNWTNGGGYAVDENLTGLVATNGVVGKRAVDATLDSATKEDCSVWRLSGPTRMLKNQYSLASLATLSEADGYELLTQSGLEADTSDRTYKYTVGTYLNNDGNVVYEVYLVDNATNEEIYHEQFTFDETVSAKLKASAGNIILYTCWKGTINGYRTDFNYSAPYVKTVTE